MTTRILSQSDCTLLSLCFKICVDIYGWLTFTAKLIPSRKKDNSNADTTGVNMSTRESRIVVQTSSEVDLVNDGYRWRKYGQKLVKGNANPRYMLNFHFKYSFIFCHCVG